MWFIYLGASLIVINSAVAVPDLPPIPNPLPLAPNVNLNSSTKVVVSSTPVADISILENVQLRQASLSAPCALVSSSSSLQIAASPTAIPTVPAQLAYDCLNSAPLNKTAALQLVDSIEPYIQWQSSLAWLKDPPKDYDFPAYDPLASLALVKDNLVRDRYPNENKFQTDLYSVFTPAHDGHFILFPDLLSRALEFSRQRSLVSISEDGRSLPVIKLFDDVIRAPKDAPIVTQINGVNTSDFVLEDARKTTGQQVLDAAYNTMFFSKAAFALGQGDGLFSGGGRGRFLFPGPTTTFTFSNGTSLTFENVAKIRGNFTNIDSGQALYQRFCDPNRNLTTPSRPPVTTPLPLVPGYPPAVVKTNSTEVSGYYLDGVGFEDIAVLSVLTFESQSPIEYQRVIETFFARAKRDGKKKLLIDLSINQGGLILLGYDMFRQLFPNIKQDGNSRWRANDNFNYISRVFSDLSKSFDPKNATETQVIQANLVFNFREDLNISDLPFESFNAKFGPKSFKSDKFTSLMRWNLEDPILTRNITFGLGTDVTGYGSRKNFTQPFAAENIVLLYDGVCASTCTIFSQFMRELAGVKSIAMGGRPIQGQIEGVGGVKGSQVLLWRDIYQYAQSASFNATTNEAEQLRRLTQLPLSRSGAAASNVRDAILAKNIGDGTPAQFIREKSDCRLYYTEHMMTDVTALWKAAADSAFNGKECAYGSLPKRSATSNGNSFSVGYMYRDTEFIASSEGSPDQSDAWLAVHNQKAIN